MKQRRGTKSVSKSTTKKAGRSKVVARRGKEKINRSRTAGKKKNSASPVVAGKETLYTLTVYIVDGPISEEYAGQEISRTIQIKGSQTLETLHYAIFNAFERWESHMYEFNLGKGPYDRSKIYSLHLPFDGFPGEDEPLGSVKTTTIDDLGLTVKRALGYVFDFGDDWQHQINVDKIEPAPGRGKYPKVTKSVGEAPPQYPEDDDEFTDLVE